MNPAAQARLFLALWPDRATRHAIAAWRDRWAWPPGAAVVADERLHLTLHFIGPVPRSRLSELQAGLEVPVPAFEIAFGHAALWPRGLALLEPLAVPAPLAALRAALADRLRALALAVEERPFRPHVTLARKAGSAQPPPAAAAFAWRAAGYALVESDHGYHSLVTYGR